MDNYDYLLQQYRSLWSGRELAVQESSERTLKQAMRSELLDEYTHPRLRRPVYEKFFLAVGRILDSSMTDEDKLTLIGMYKSVAENTKEGK